MNPVSRVSSSTLQGDGGGIYLPPMNSRGFSLIEIIGVLAILAIVTALLIPRVSRQVGKPSVMETVDNARIAEALVAVQAIQAASTAHCAQFGSLAALNGAPLAVTGAYDKFGAILLQEGFIERPFGLKLGTNALVRLVNVGGLSAASAVDASNGAYDLSGKGRNDVVGAAFVVEIVIPGVSEAEARALNDRLDGPALGANAAGDDLAGKVIYRAAPSGSPREVHVYVMQR